MDEINNQTIQAVRSYNRFYTDLLGLLNRHILDSPYSLTEVRILYEIDKIRNCTANILMDKLNIDRGYMSRLLKRFESNNLISKKNSSTDGRALYLTLTPEGRDILSKLEEKSGIQVQKLIRHLSENEMEILVKSMKYIKHALSDGICPVTIRSYCDKDLEYIINRHKELYESEYGFRPIFGDYVEKYVMKFHLNHDEKYENIWIAEIEKKQVGIIAVVKATDSVAQLRWFLLEPEIRGRGIGHKLMKTAIDFCKKKGYKHIFLMTVSLLDAARHLYRSYGFKLTEASENNEWSDNIIEERWDLDI